MHRRKAIEDKFQHGGLEVDALPAETARPRLLLLIPHLGGGGAERVIELLARGLSARKYEIHLGLILADPSPLADTLPEWVTVHRLDQPRVRVAALPLLKLVRSLRPQLILSGIFHLNFLVLLLRPFFPSETKLILRQNGTASAALADGNLVFYNRLFYRFLYPRADMILCQTSAMADDLAEHFRVPRHRLTVVPNPVDFDAIRAALGEEPYPWPGPGPHLVAIGRLAPEKGFDLLLEALALLRRQHPHADLFIAGTGPEESALKALAACHGIGSAVRFAGQLPQAARCLPGATLFVLSSRHEGLPNALLEAAVAGLPIVATPACSGLVDLLRDQPGVWIADEISAPALAAALHQALSHLEPGQRFPHPFVETFRMDRAIRAYELIIDATLAASALPNNRQLQ